MRGSCVPCSPACVRFRDSLRRILGHQDTATSMLGFCRANSTRQGNEEPQNCGEREPWSCYESRPYQQLEEYSPPQTRRTLRAVADLLTGERWRVDGHDRGLHGPTASTHPHRAWVGRGRCGELSHEAAPPDCWVRQGSLRRRPHFSVTRESGDLDSLRDSRAKQCQDLIW